MIQSKINTTAFIYFCRKNKDTYNPVNGIQNIEFICEYRKGPNYEMLDNSKLLRGPHKGKIKFKVTSYDYTDEHGKRKVKYKLASGSSKIGHLSKLTPCGPNRYHGDIHLTSDKLLVYWKEERFILIVIQNGKHDYSLVNDWSDGLLDYLLS